MATYAPRHHARHRRRLANVGAILSGSGSGGGAALTDPEPLLYPMSRGKNLGSPQNWGSLPTANADGLPIEPITDEIRYHFDTKGWVCIPGVLGAGRAAQMREAAQAAFAAGYSWGDAPFHLGVPPGEETAAAAPNLPSSPVGGVLGELCDHPLLVGFMHEFLAHPSLSSEVCYGFRQESTHLEVRPAGWGADRDISPHNGNGLVRLPGDGHYYSQVPGKAGPSLTCVIWELEEISEDGGGTIFVDVSNFECRSRGWEHGRTHPASR
eukprot:SAG22_NODE_142_length_17922_cov_10.990406_22_plen_267_part_00